MVTAVNMTEPTKSPTTKGLLSIPTPTNLLSNASQHASSRRPPPPVGLIAMSQRLVARLSTLGRACKNPLAYLATPDGTARQESRASCQSPFQGGPGPQTARVGGAIVSRQEGASFRPTGAERKPRTRAPFCAAQSRHRECLGTQSQRMRLGIAVGRLCRRCETTSAECAVCQKGKLTS